MTLPANSFTNTSPPAPTPNAWSEFYFAFQQPYVYTGGDLALLFSHPGSNDSSLAPYPETVASSASTYGVGYYDTSYPPGSAGALSTFYVHRLHFGYGDSCPAGGTAPVLVLNGNTTGGGTVLLTLQNGPASAPATWLIGLGRTSIPILGCTLLTLPLFDSSTVLDGNGIARLPETIPPFLRGSANIQGIVLDPSAPYGFATSNGVEFTAN
ncbi:MAG: hypothetical protein H6834_08365 [Planctomycetes bacterium]|nr:hypothetical protein [Planctomycetota bacterium]